MKTNVHDSKIFSDKELYKTLTPIWFMPLHAVYHLKKSNEPRIVFYCASECDGTSLNTYEQHKFPVGVLLPFRVEEVAVAADIKQMFHQVSVVKIYRR